MKKLVLCAVLLAGCMSAEEEAAAVNVKNAAARAWCDRMGIRITGVSCKAYGRECAVAPENGTPFRLLCHGDGTCSLPVPGAP